MRTCQYIATKRAISQQKPIPQETYDELVVIRDNYQKKIDAMTASGDVEQATFFTNSKEAVEKMISEAIIQNT